MKAGDQIFFDKKNPEISFVAPVSGELIELNRGEKRSVEDIVILADKEQQYRSYDLPNLSEVNRNDLVQFLSQSGVWPLIRQRPFGTVASLEESPRDIFISCFNSGPLAPDLNFVVQGQEAHFQKGLDVLSKLTEGSVYLGLSASQANAAAFEKASGVVKKYYSGPHPAGNVGIQIHHTAPINKGDIVWTIDVQSILTIGRLFNDGKYLPVRLVALSGNEVDKPRYFKTIAGANLESMISSNLTNDHVRIVLGDVLTGRKVDSNAYLGAQDDLITVLEEGDHYEMFGWLFPQSGRPTISKSFPNGMFNDLHFKANTNTHGEKRAFVVTGQYEQVLPMDIMPQHLFKAILANDLERMEGLGIYELEEEDIALCEFACTSKQNLQEILRKGLDFMQEQG